MAALLWLVAVAATATTASADCSTQPAWAETDKWIVGQQAEEWMIENNGIGNFIRGWNASEPVDIQFGCAVNYFLIWGDEVHVRVTKMVQHSMLEVSYVQELQSPDSAQVTTPRWYYAWEKHVPFYASNGGPGPGEWDDWDHPGTLAGGYSWPLDRIESHEEARCDFYHQLQDAKYKWYHFRSGSQPESRCWEYVGPEHVGEIDGQLRTVLYTGFTSQLHNDFGELTKFEGQMTWTEHTGAGGFKPDQYQALKQFYLDTCRDRRGGAAWNEPWETEWTWDWHVQNVHRNSDDAPYCSWLKETGWNDAYWESEAVSAKYDCLMIPGITCDPYGNIDSVHLVEMGLKGNAEILMNAVAANTRVFWVSFNSLSGSLPQSFGSNSILADFDVWRNNFGGELPCLTSPTITHLDISYNLFTHVPSCFFTEDRTNLFMEHNAVVGTIDPLIGRMTSAWTVWLSYNIMTGTIPEDMCKMTGVEDLDFGGNRLRGSIPNNCLNAPDGESGWYMLKYFNAHHNRLTGTLPQISAEGRVASACVCNLQCGYTSEDFTQYSYWYYYVYYVAWWENPVNCRVGSFDFDHNFFSGEYAGEWDAVVALSASKKGILTLRAEGCLLSGALPSKVKDWSFFPGNTHYNFIYALEDNLFRCEKDGRWPDWTLRYENPGRLGQCLPIAHPLSVSPKEATIGQAGQLSVEGRDFVSKGQQRCKYVSTGAGGEEVVVAATRVSDVLVRCLVPADMGAGTYRITVSNHADEWASSALIDGFTQGESLTVSIIKPVVPATADALSVTMELTGVDAESFDSGSFISGIAALLDVSPANVVLGTERRLQGAQSSSYSVGFVLLTAGASQSMDDIVSTLEDEDRVKNSLVSAGMTSVTGARATVAYTRAETATDNKTESELPILWIAIGGAAGVIACCLCGFIVMIYRMEKKGQSYFKEELNDDASTAPASDPRVIGKTEESNEV